MNNEGERELQYQRRLRVLMRHILPEGGEQQSQATPVKTPEELYGAAKLPGKVKQQEAPYDKDNVRTEGDIVKKEGVSEAPIRINAAYYDLTENGGGFTPAGGVIYLWAIRDDGHLVVGVEDPTKMPAAFGVDPKTVVAAMQSRKAELGEEVPQDNVLDGLGHPTLAVRFGPSGEALVGSARISGELEEHSGSWKINDHSGRYSAGRTEVVPFLINAATKFQQFGIDVQYIQSKVQLDDRIMPLADLQKAAL